MTTETAFSVHIFIIDGRTKESADLAPHHIKWNLYNAGLLGRQLSAHR